MQMCDLTLFICSSGVYRKFVPKRRLKREVLMIFLRPYDLVLSLGIVINISRSMNSHDERNQSDRLVN
jgi:hypothetical protein